MNLATTFLYRVLLFPFSILKKYWWHFLIAFGIFIVDFILFLRSPLFVDERDYVLHFEKRGSAQSLYATLSKDKPLSSHVKLKLLLRLSPDSKSLKAGIYHVPASTTPLGLLKKLVEGDVIKFDITIVPGMRFSDLVEVLDKAPFLVRTESLSLEMRKLCDIKVDALDGAFLPESYQYEAGTKDTALLKRSCEAMKEILSQIWDNRDKTLPYQTPEELLSAASIIEKETALPKERPLVSAVIVNRLNKGMKLQMDPTVIYALGKKYQGVLYKKQLKWDNPYNTYLYRGLPPTAIAFPSRDALIAAAHPASVDYYYFVATGEGGHQFSRTLKEQREAVKAYKAIKEKRKHRES